MKVKILFISCLFSIGLYAQKQPVSISRGMLTIRLQPSAGILWEYKTSGIVRAIGMRPPVFEIDGRNISGEVAGFTVSREKDLRNGVAVYTASGPLKADPGIRLSISFRIAGDNPVVRFRYTLKTGTVHRLTKKEGTDDLRYFSFSLAGNDHLEEIRLSDFNELCHTNLLSGNEVTARCVEDSQSVMGPILIAGNGRNSYLVAYEHGSQYPDRFLEYRFSGKKEVSLYAVKGNYVNRQLLDPANGYETIWFELAGVAGSEEILASYYRRFILKYITENAESRQPYIFYNTWGRQERSKWAGNKYLTSMTLETTLKEIEVGHQLGIEVYVLDMGWYQKSGDWEVNTVLFPDSLRQVKALLDKYHMKLGLWLNPLVAAVTSRLLAENERNRAVLNGKPDDPFPIWETEASVRLSLVSPFWKSLAEKLISVAREYGVSYFKWDGISQYGVNGTGHYYGNAENTAREREENYAFQLPVYMNKVIEKVNEVLPDIVFDFDITEEGRSMGLAFLSAGKYFIMNNGPYFHSYNLAPTWGSPLANGNANIFVNPGPARGWIARSVLCYDKWIPSVLLLTHYQPDGDERSQLINAASLILGQNGLWGDLLSLPAQNVSFFHGLLERYKQVREDITVSDPVMTGRPGMSPEIYEKLNGATGRGVVVIFANAPGDYTYVTQQRASDLNWHTEGATVKYDSKGRAVIHVHFTESSARIIFFGIK